MVPPSRRHPRMPLKQFALAVGGCVRPGLRRINSVAGRRGWIRRRGGGERRACLRDARTARRSVRRPSRERSHHCCRRHRPRRRAGCPCRPYGGPCRVESAVPWKREGARSDGIPVQGVGSDHDSLGIFQQRAGWGTATQRLDPTTSTNRFLDALLALPDWHTNPPWVALSRFRGPPTTAPPAAPTTTREPSGPTTSLSLAASRHPGRDPGDNPDRRMRRNRRRTNTAGPQDAFGLPAGFTLPRTPRHPHGAPSRSRWHSGGSRTGGAPPDQTRSTVPVSSSGPGGRRGYLSVA